MPKVKRIRAAALDAQQTRHAPLGQVIQADESRGKFAATGKMSTRPRRDSEDDQEELLDEKTSSRILEMSREQQLEIEKEEQRQRRAGEQKQAKESRRYVDSEDEEEQEDEQSVLLDEYETE